MRVPEIAAVPLTPPPRLSRRKAPPPPALCLNVA